MQPLQPFRERLNDIDARIIKLLGERFDVVREVGLCKKINNIPMMQSRRVEEVKQRCAEIGKQFELDIDFIKAIYTLIINEACRIEDDIIDAE